ncbi:MAG: ankyrin repeat domain-containing protein [Legionella sp.]|nr:ankyrin repeat domain-containing protein [Legionella sp.]
MPQYELHTLCQNNTPTVLVDVTSCHLKGADINQLDDKGHTPLWYAVNIKNIEVVRYLLAQQADPNLAGAQTCPPLVQAVDQNSQDICIELLSKPETDVNARQIHNVTALFVAAQEGREALVDLLLKNEADPTLCMGGSNTSPLHSAIRNGHNSIVKKLIISIPSLVNLEKIFLKPINRSPLSYASFIGNLHAVDLLLKKEAHINAVTMEKGKMTPVCYAAFKGHGDIIEKLIASGADYINVGAVAASDNLVSPLELATRKGHLYAVKCLLRHHHPEDHLKRALHYSMVNALASTGGDERQRYFAITVLIQEQKEAQYSETVLTLNDESPIPSSSFISSFEYLFSQQPDVNDTNPGTKDAAIRRALTAMYDLLRNPSACLPYLYLINEELERQWMAEQHDQPFPVFNEKWVTLCAHNGMLWPIPHNNIPQMKRFNTLDRILLAKFHQYEMGNEQLKWTGFIPRNFSRTQLFENAFVVENYRTINGLFHGNIHNLQRVIAILAMESGLIPLTYQENGQEHKVLPKEIFSALMRRDILPSGKIHAPLWTKIFDSGSIEALNFNHPYQFHSTLLTNSKLAGTLQDYLRFSFCSHYNLMRDLYNGVYETGYNNQKLWQHVISKLYLHLFSGKPEFAIQMEEKKSLSDDAGRKWHSRTKIYNPLRLPIFMTGEQGFFSQHGSRSEKSDTISPRSQCNA